MKKARCSTAILISGGGTNLQSFINYVASEPDNKLDLSVVLSNRPDAYGLERATLRGLMLEAEPFQVPNLLEKPFA